MTSPAQRKKPLHPPLVTLRALREAYGIAPDGLVQRIAEQGCEVSKHTIRGVENGNYAPSAPLITAWAKALRLNPADVILPPNGNGGDAA